MGVGSATGGVRRLETSVLSVLAAAAALVVLVSAWHPSDWEPRMRYGMVALPGLAAIAGAYGWLGARRLVLQKDARGYRLRAVDLWLLVGVPFLTLAIADGRQPVPEGETLGTLVARGGGLTPWLAARSEKTVAALLTLCAGGLLFAGLKRRHGERAALATLLVFLFATTAFSRASQALWPVTVELVLVCFALFLVLHEDASAGRLALASAAVGGAVLVGWSAHADPAGGSPVAQGWWSWIGEGLLGNLVSPSRGLLPYFPYLLLVPFGLFELREDRELRRLWLTSLSVILGIYLLASASRAWFEGYSLGPGPMTEAAPFLALLTLPLWLAFRKVSLATRLVSVACVLFAVATQVLITRSAAAFEWNNGIFDREPGRRRVWAVRDSQLTAAWSPILDVRTRRPPEPEIPDDPDGWRHLDLRGAANASWDHDPFFPGNTTAWSHYGSAMSRVADARRNLFRFLPRGNPNVATTCREVSRIEVRVPLVACSRLHAVLAAGVTVKTPGNPVLARLEVEHQDGSIERFPLHLDRDVWEYAASRRSSPIDPAKLYRGGPQDADALVKASFLLARPTSPLTALRVVNEDPGSSAGVTLFALTLER